MVSSTQTVHLSCVKISTMCENNRNELPLEPCHLVVTSSVSKMISKPMVCLAQTMHLSCTDANTVSKWKQVRFCMTHVTKEFHRCVQNDFRTYGTFNANGAPILRQDYLDLQTDQNELPLEPRLLVLPLGASKIISEPMVRLAQTMHLSHTDNKLSPNRKK